MRRERNTVGWWWLALALILLVFALRILAIPSMYLREDEEIAFRTTENHEVGYTIWYNTTQDVHVPTWFVSFWFWQQLVGSTEYMARVYSILLSLMTAALTYRLGYEWFGSPRYGVFALVALGVSAYALIYSLEIRPYAMLMLAAAFSLWTFQRWLTRNTWRRALLWGASAAALLWIHYYTVFLVMAQVAFLLINRPNRRMLRQTFGAGGFAFLLWLPVLPVFVGQVLHLAQEEVASGDFRGIGIGSTTQRTSLPIIAELVEISSNGSLPLYGLLLILGGLLLYRRRNYWLALTVAFGGPAINLLVNFVASVYTQRYVTYLAIGLAVAIGATLAALPGRFGLRWLALIGFAALNLVMLPGHIPQRTPYRDIFQTVSALAQPDDAVYFIKGREDGHWIGWQVKHYLSPTLNSNIIKEWDVVLEARRVWFVTGELLAEDVQAVFHELETTHPVQRVIGECNREWCYVAQLMAAPPQTEATIFGEDMAFWGADIPSVTNNEVDVRLWWRVSESPTKDYSIGLQLLNAEGALVAQHDGPINHYDAEIFQTSQLEPNKIYIDYRRLALPDDLPPGEYDLILVVYQPWDGARLTLPDDSDHLFLETITIP